MLRSPPRNTKTTALESQSTLFVPKKGGSTSIKIRNFLLWRQVLRCLDWRMKWDLRWTREDNLNKLHKGGSRWHSGEQWERPSPIDFERMRQEYPEGTPGADEFYARHRRCFEDKHQPDHAFLATVYTVGVMCDRLEKKSSSTLSVGCQHGIKPKRMALCIAKKVYDEMLRQCLVTCNETLKSMVAPLKIKANALGEEKVRHAGWLDQVSKSGVAMTKEQLDEIRYAIVKGRPHLDAKMKSETPPVALATTGSGDVSSSGLRYQDSPRRSPSHNPPVRNPILSEAQGVPSPRTPLRGAAKRVRSDRRNDDPFAPTVQRHRDEQARAAPSYGRNPNVDFRLVDRPAWHNPASPERAVPPIEVLPGEWVPGRVRDAAARAEAARAAAAALPYADDRRRNLPVAAVARPRPIVPPERPRAVPVVYADRDRSLPPRREASRRSPGRSLVHPENPRLVWSYLGNRWVHRLQDDSEYRGARSRSPSPRQVRDPHDDPYRVTW